MAYAPNRRPSTIDVRPHPRCNAAFVLDTPSALPQFSTRRGAATAGASTREEAIAVRELTRSARWRTGMGIATIIASIAYGQSSDSGSFSDRMLRDALMYVGVDMIRSSQVRKQEKRLHTETLEELAQDFDDSIEPMVVEIQGTQHRLTGTADAQYDEWRQLLRQMFIRSPDSHEDVAIYTEAEPDRSANRAAARAGVADRLSSSTRRPARGCRPRRRRPPGRHRPSTLLR
jgi:hypothetical protein